MKKIQVSVDGETERLLKNLAGSRAGNKSFVVREAVRRMAEQEGFEQYLDWLEQQPKVRVPLERALSDERQDRVTPHARVLKRFRRTRRR